MMSDKINLKSNLYSVIHLIGSIASITGISLLAIDKALKDIDFFSIAIIVIGTFLGFGIFSFFALLIRVAFRSLENDLGKSWAFSVCVFLIGIYLSLLFGYIFIVKYTAFEMP